MQKCQKLYKKKKKNCFVLFWRLVRELIQSQAHTEIFRNSLAGQCPSREKYLEYFSKFEFLMFLIAQSGDLFAGGGFSHKGTQRFLRLTRDSFTGRTSSREKHLEIFFL